MSSEQVAAAVALDALEPDMRAVVEAEQGRHEPAPTPEGWVDCTCGWESNHVRLPSVEETAARVAVARFDEETALVPPAPHKPELHPMIPPTDDEIADLRLWNDWQRAYGSRVRPSEPTDSTGDPDPDRTNDAEWRTHVVAAGRDAGIAKHVADGGTLKDVPPDLAMLGVEPIGVEVKP